MDCGCFFHILAPPCAERASACGKDYFFRFLCLFTLQALENGGMLAVHGHERGSMASDEARDQVSGHDKRLLVGQGYCLSSFDGLYGREEAAVAHHGGYHRVDTAVRHGFGYGFASCFDLYREA